MTEDEDRFFAAVHEYALENLDPQFMTFDYSHEDREKLLEVTRQFSLREMHEAVRSSVPCAIVGVDVLELRMLQAKAAVCDAYMADKANSTLKTVMRKKVAIAALRELEAANAK